MVNSPPAMQEIWAQSLGWERSPGEREWLSTSVFLPREFHGQKSLAGYNPWGCKELDTTEQLTFTFFHCSWVSQVVLVVKNLPANAGDLRDADSIPGL